MAVLRHRHYNGRVDIPIGKERIVGEWDFLWDLGDEEFEEALISYANRCDWDESAVRERKAAWDALKAKREGVETAPGEFDECNRLN